ncbi:MAG: DNA-binding protein [Nanoarchaeota archaeon]
MDELEALKRKRLAELQKQQETFNQQAEEQNQMQQQIEQLESVVKQIMSKEALIRYGNIKAAHPEKTVQVLVVIGQLLQQGKIRSITDSQLKDILTQLAPEKKDFKIKRI